jgi:RimJ/RimL family protein N-acetyltransferase
MKHINDFLSLRKPNMEDIDDLFILKNDEETNLLLGGFSNGYSKEDIANWIGFHNNAKDECLYVIVKKEDNIEVIIGHVGFYNIDFRISKAEFAISISNKNYRGKGFGKICTEFMINFAFENLNLNKIELSLLSVNKVAYDFYLKQGFVQEGLLKYSQFKNGFYHDVVLMAKFRNDI